MINRTMLSILKVLEKTPDRFVGSREISRQLSAMGIDLTERTVRYHLRIMDEKGLTRVFGKEGRKITLKGAEEISQSHVSEKVGFVINRIESLSYLSDFDLDGRSGNIILNVSFIPEDRFREALTIMAPVFESRYNMSPMVAVAESGAHIGEVQAPEGYTAFGTVCSVTANSALSKAGIPVTSKFGGVLQIEDGEPSRFTALISYEGSSLDPLEIFIKSGMTDVRGAVNNNSGKILASFREIPFVCVERTRQVQKKMEDSGLGGILAIGSPNQELLEIPVGMDKAGVVVVGGLNPVAAVEEAGITTVSKAMSTLYEYSRLIEFREIAGGYR